ncbi:MAG TPA: zinc-binding dehydrogenase [Bdellovibrionota bacterium]|nr:zinc-binding dehydrogenase [Bdellovibrionota bacterium]
MIQPFESQATMRAAVLTGPRTCELKRIPIPTPGPNELRIRIQGCGVCGSNAASWEGMPWTQYPMEPGAPGHETWGTVDALGPGVNDFRLGERVTALSYRGYAEYDLAKASETITLPQALDALPFPGEAFGCAMNIFRRSEIRAGQTVAIVGIGFLGAALTRLVSKAGARVLAISRRPYALEIAKAMGADELIPMDDHAKIISRVKALTSGVLCDRVLEAAGKQWPLDLSAELTRERGRLIIAGYHQDGPRQVNMQLWNWRGLDVINAHERDPQVYLAGIRDSIQATVSGTLNPDMLITKTFPLERLAEALEATIQRPDGFLKAVVML